MKKIILLCLTALFACNLKAQTQNVDSLVNVLETQKLTAKEQLELYDKICKAYQRYNREKFITYSEKGLHLAQKEKDKNMTAMFYRYLGLSYTSRNEYDTAKIYYEKALDLTIEIKDKNFEANIYQLLGNLYARQNNNTLALQYHLKALPIFETLGNKKGCMGVFINIGSIYYALHNNERALYYIKQAETIAEELNDNSGKLGVYYNLGEIYYFKNEFDTAVYYELKMLEISRIVKSKTDEIFSLQSLAHIYSGGIKDYGKAEEYAIECLRIAEEYGDWRNINGAYHVLSLVYLHQKRYKDSEIVALKAWEIDSTATIENIGIVINLIKSYIHLGNKDKADYFFQKYIDIMEIYNEKSYRDSITDMEIKYETEKKELRIAALEKEKTLYTLIIIISVVAALFAFAILFYRHKLNVQKCKHVEQQVKQLEQEKQLVAAQALIDGEAAERSRLARDLHDGLGGMLSVVKLNLKDMKGYSVLDNLDIDHFNKAMVMLDQSISELRRVAHHIMPESLMRHGLKTSLDDFCRAIPGANFRFFGDDTDLDNRLKTLIYRCAYELINNAVKHANATNINVQLMIENGLVSLSVHDDGTGFDPEKVMEGSGLENVRIRVASYNGKMNIYSSPGKGTEVSIEIEPS